MLHPSMKKLAGLRWWFWTVLGFYAIFSTSLTDSEFSFLTRIKNFYPAEPGGVVRPELKEAFLVLRHAASSGEIDR